MPHKNKPELLVEFFSALRVAQASSDDVDNFDLHSENESSRAEWKKLLRDQAKEVEALVRLIQASGDDILERMKILQTIEEE